MLKSVRPGEYAPIHVQIELTWRCNWRCVHCYQDDHTIEILRLSEIKRLLAQLADAGTMHIIVTGGEPLVHQDVFQVLAAIRSYGMAITLYTNGHLVDDRLAERLSELIAMAEISVLAGDELIHDQLTRVRGSFRRTWGAIEALKRRDVDVMVKTPLLKPAYHTLHALALLVKKFGVSWNVDPEISRTYAGKLFPLAYQLPPHDLRRFFEEFPEFNPQMGYSSDPGLREGMCLAARQYAFIDALGNVYPCLNFKSASDIREAEGLPAQAKLGNIRTQSFAEIWEHAEFACAIRSAQAGDFKTCAGCSARQGCTPCMALNYEASGDLFQPAQAVCNVTAAAASVFDTSFIPASRLALASAASGCETRGK